MSRIISPVEYYEATQRLADEVISSKFDPRLIAAIGGGMTPGGVLGELLGIKVRGIDVERPDGDKRVLTYDLQMKPDEFAGMPILVLEDCVPTGRGASLRLVRDVYSQRRADVRLAAPIVGENTPVDYKGLLIKEPFRLYWKPTR